MTATDTATQDGGRSTILVIDDSSEYLILMGELLHPYFRVLTANSGERGLELAHASPPPDLILLDILMPDMDGYEVLRRLRADPATAAIPVIFVSMMGEDEDEAHGLALGAVDYISKPTRPAILLARVRTHLELRRHRQILEQRNLRLESEAAERSQTLRAILDAAEQTILMITPEGEILAINRIGAQRLGGTPEAMVGQNLYDFFPPEVARHRRERFLEAMRSGAPLTFEDERLGRRYRTNVIPLLEAAPRLVIYATDITAQYAAERRFSEVVALASEGIATLDGRGRINFANPRLHAMLGVEPGHLLGRTLAEFTAQGEPAGECQGRLAALHDATAPGVMQFTCELKARDGAVFTAQISAATRTTPAEAPLAADSTVVVVTDISAEARIQAALKDALRVVEASPVVCFRWRAEPGWPVDYVSENVRQWGYDAAELRAGRPPFTALVYAEDLGRIAEEVARLSAEGQDEFRQQYRLVAADGRVFWVDDHTHVVRDAEGRPRFYEGVVRDIDETKRYELELAANLAEQQALNKKLEEAHNQLLQSEKMASIGQLAAGVAHELNNPIGFISSNLGTLEGYLRDLLQIADDCERAAAEAHGEATPLGHVHKLMLQKDYTYLKEDIWKLLEESKDGLQRVRKIVQDLKDFSRTGQAQWQWADLHQGLESTLNIVWNELKYKCEVRREYGNLPQVYCMPSQLNQVFMNLLVNAGQAIADKGVITLRTGCAGDEVWVEVEDTGCGIPEENLKRIFDPFFTTKPVGKGTGLGLSIAYGIVSRHQGRIEVASTPGKGSRFRVWLPIEPKVEARDEQA